jgi:hypothetical protein
LNGEVTFGEVTFGLIDKLPHCHYQFHVSFLIQGPDLGFCAIHTSSVNLNFTPTNKSDYEVRSLSGIHMTVLFYNLIQVMISFDVKPFC